MLAAKLVDLVVDLVRYPDLLVVFSVVEHGAIDQLAVEAVHDFYLVEEHD